MTRKGNCIPLLVGLVWFLLSSSLQALPIYAQGDFKADFSGYLQEQELYTPDFFGFELDLSSTRFRPVLDFQFGRGVSAEFSQTLQASAGGALDNPVYVLAGKAQPYTFFKWDKRLSEEDDFWLDYSVYRAWLAYEDEKIKVVVGRQRIAFGSANFYSPMDLFNPVSPLSLEPQERVGVDGASFEYDYNPTTFLTLALGLADQSDRRRMAAYFKTTVKSYDLHFLIAQIFTDYVLGFGFSGYLQGGGLYGEVTYTMPQEMTFEPDQGNYFRTTLGYQYSFKNAMILTAEYYHNDGVISGLALQNPALLFSSESGLTTVDRNFLAASLSAQVTPILTSNAAIVYDLDAGSYFLGPSLTFSAPHSVTLAAGAQIFDGSKHGDFGLMPSFLWGRVKWDF